MNATLPCPHCAGTFTRRTYYTAPDGTERRVTAWTPPENGDAPCGNCRRMMEYPAETLDRVTAILEGAA